VLTDVREYVSQVLGQTAIIKDSHGIPECTMTPTTRHVKKHARARQRRRLITQERLERDRRQAQHAAEALQQALDDLGLPEDLVTEIEGRLRSQQKLLGKIVGVMCPPLFGCRTNTELCRVRGWDKNLPSRLLSALPKRSWLKRLRRLGLEGLVPLWRYAASCVQDLISGHADERWGSPAPLPTCGGNGSDRGPPEAPPPFGRLEAVRS
jgi:hypothetical protein